MIILNQHQIEQKIHRLAIEILESNYGENEIILLGINNRGYRFAEMLLDRLQYISDISLSLHHLTISPQNPLQDPITIDRPLSEMNAKTVMVIDDVANTGRTLFYACKPLMDILPKRLETVVLVDRKHKSFPIRVDYVGLSLATTLKEDIDVHILEGEQAVYLR
ncbi:MAG: phosphoribosyltransferase [Saprospiraceae bacterium]|nr:phosphoribosyltransferase [Saprospiraceae bacterium]